MQFCSNQNKIIGCEASNAPEVLMAKWKFCLVVMMVEVLDVILGGVEGLPF